MPQAVRLLPPCAFWQRSAKAAGRQAAVPGADRGLRREYLGKEQAAGGSIILRSVDLAGGGAWVPRQRRRANEAVSCLRFRARAGFVWCWPSAGFGSGFPSGSGVDYVGPDAGGGDFRHRRQCVRSWTMPVSAGGWGGQLRRRSCGKTGLPRKTPRLGSGLRFAGQAGWGPARNRLVAEGDARSILQPTRPREGLHDRVWLGRSVRDQKADVGV